MDYIGKKTMIKGWLSLNNNTVNNDYVRFKEGDKVKSLQTSYSNYNVKNIVYTVVSTSMGTDNKTQFIRVLEIPISMASEYFVIATETDIKRSKDILRNLLKKHKYGKGNPYMIAHNTAKHLIIKRDEELFWKDIYND